MMKKTFQLILICLVAAFVAVPQMRADFRYGATAGINVSTLKLRQDLITVDQSVGYQAGVQCEMMFPGIGFGLDFGLMYNQLGATLHFGEKQIWASEGIGTKRSYLHFASIPINLRFKWTRMNGIEDYFAPYIFGGPVFSILVAHNNVEPLQYSGGDLGLQAGIGFEINKRWQVQGSYMWGMSYAAKTKLLQDFTARNRVWSLRVVRFF